MLTVVAVVTEMAVLVVVTMSCSVVTFVIHSVVGLGSVVICLVVFHRVSTVVVGTG